MNRQDWLTARRSGIGATDAASLIGEGFSNPLQVYRSKVESAQNDEPHPLLQIGLATEAINAGLYSRATGAELIKADAINRHPDREIVLASLDYLTAEYREPVDTKYTPFFSDEWGEPGTDQIPLGYIVQLQWQMLATHAGQADISALSGTGEHRVYRLQRNDVLIEALYDSAQEFWGRFVLAQAPPPDDWQPMAFPAIAREIARVQVGNRVDLPIEYLPLVEELERAKQIAKEAGAIVDENKAKLAELMGEAERATIGVYVLSRTVVEGAQVPAYYRKPYVRFTIKPPKAIRKP
ncbi:MAG: YqaJ viral recombinase family protein [Planctomycetia bacterium]